jgi:hypothetical protein
MFLDFRLFLCVHSISAYNVRVTIPTCFVSDDTERILFLFSFTGDEQYKLAGEFDFGSCKSNKRSTLRAL